jgi:predicted Zn-dependent protease
MDFLARLEGRRRLARAGRTTYFDSLFAETDSVVRRWPDIKGLIFTVAVPPDTSGRDAPLLDIITRALRAWEAASLGLRFTVRTDSAGADIVAYSTQVLGEDRAGQTDVRWSPGGAIHSAVITLARRDQQNRVIPPEILHAIAVHEIGHALGMSHSPDPADVMFPSTRAGTLSSRDAATFRLLYQLPLGTIRETPP